MRRYLQALSPQVEFAVVIAVAFGYFIFASLAWVFAPAPAGIVSDAQLGALLGYELALLAVLLPFLHVRGWTLARVGFRFDLWDPAVALALAVAGYVVFITLFWTIAGIWPQAAQAMRGSGGASPSVSLSAVIAVSLLNPVFEEIFVCGYVVSALKERPDPWTGIHVSVAIRLLYHLYQGAISTIGIVPIGLIFAIWYARTGRLWPVIIAHVLWDFVGLVQFVK